MATPRLLELQETDSALDRLAARRKVLESGQELEAARAEADRAERALGEIGLQLDELARDQMRFEHEIDSMSQKEHAEQTRLYDGSIANAKELEALQREIESVRKRRSDREDELLVIMERREALEAASAQAAHAAEDSRASAQRAAGDAEQELSVVIGELTTRAETRNALASTIEPELLELYDDLRRQKKGVGAAALIDGVCQGCHEQLSAVQLDRLKRTDGVKRCEHCRRILVD
jgi:predicted  nucleic acid-binding Zn-ribbon protein